MESGGLRTCSFGGKRPFAQMPYSVPGKQCAVDINLRPSYRSELHCTGLCPSTEQKGSFCPKDLAIWQQAEPSWLGICHSIWEEAASHYLCKRVFFSSRDQLTFVPSCSGRRRQLSGHSSSGNVSWLGGEQLFQCLLPGLGGTDCQLRPVQPSYSLAHLPSV